MKNIFQSCPLLALLIISTVNAIKSPINMSPGTISHGTTDDLPDYLYYGALSTGAGRSMLQLDATISKAMGWGQKFIMVQFNQSETELSNPETFQIPSTSQYDARQGIAIGTNFFLSCYDDDLFNQQHSLNLKCSKDPKCSSAYMVTILWGTLGKMNFKKDRILLATCGIVQVDGGDSCNFPDSPACRVRLFQDKSSQHVSGLMESGEAVQVGIAGSVGEVSNIIQSFATKMKQKITLPSGTQTK